MGKNYKEIMLELATLENLITEMEQVVLVFLPLEFTSLLKLKIEGLKTYCSDEAVKPGHTEKLEAELNNLVELFIQQSQAFLKGVAAKEKINWVLPLEYATETQPLRQFNLILQSFKTSVEETNVTLLVKLDSLQETWQSSKRKEKVRKLEQISSYKEKINQFPTQLCINREQFQSVCMRKNHRRVVIADHHSSLLSDSQLKQVTLNEVIEALKAKLKKEAGFHEGFLLDFSNLDQLSQYDASLNQWLIQLKELNHDSQQLIEKMRPVITSLSASIETQDQLNNAILRMMDLNKTREKLRSNILERQANLQPTSPDLAGLKEELRFAREEAQKALEYFLMTFSTIHLEGKTDQDTLFFTKRLVGFIEEILVNLQAEDLHLDTQGIEKFRIQLLEHLGEKAHWYELNKPTINALDRSAINEFLNELFNAPASPATSAPFLKGAQKLITDLLQTNRNEIDESLLRKQIVMFRSLTCKLKQFEVKQITGFHTLKEIQLAKEKKIERVFEEMESKLSSGRGLLQDKLMLFSNQFGKIVEVTNGYEIINDYYELGSQLKRVFARYNENKQKIELVSSPLERLDKLTDLQEKVLAEFTLIENQFIGENGLYPRTLNQILALEERYGLARYWLVHDLSTEIEATREVLLTYYPSGAVNKTLRPYSTKFEQLRLTQETNLSKIQTEVERLIKALKKQADEVNLRLFEDYHPCVQSLIMRRFPRTEHFNDINPYKAEVSEKTLEAATVVEEVIKALNELKSAPPSSLRKSLDTLVETIKAAEQKLQERDQVLESARIIEKRLDSVSYKKSVLAIETMQREYTRILQKHVVAAIETYPEDKEHFEALLKIPGTAENYLKLAHCMEYLDEIDPRLFKLLAMQFQFAQINKSYINHNLFMMLDEDEQLNEIGIIIIDQRETYNRLLERVDQRYLSNIIENVNRTIHNTQMESLSDGILPDFVQWIRVNILKPLQALKHYVGSYFKFEDNPKDRFFKPIPKTPWPSRTEEELVNTGNRILDELYCVAAASAA